jgi:threonine/homoserine/homoserine lactone efflux protein
MYGTHDLALYGVSCLLLAITPGQDTMFILGRSIAQGKRAGVISVAGIMSGILIHTLMAALGLSVILATSSLAFNIVKYAGAVYLIWIGVGLLRSGPRGETPVNTQEQRLKLWTVYRQGLLTNLLNPKVSLFFLSFLPQFVDPQTVYTFVPFLVLGLILFVTGGAWCLVLARSAAWLSQKLRHRASAGGRIKKLTGALFIGLGVKLAFSRHH